MKLIDLDEFLEDHFAYAAPELIRDGDYILEKLLKAETLDAEPVLHGEWKWSEGGQCSVCGFHTPNTTWNYCPECGAKMDGRQVH